jgi:hypothetical protein
MSSCLTAHNEGIIPLYLRTRVHCQSHQSALLASGEIIIKMAQFESKNLIFINFKGEANE